jgi:hypothetical protein
MRRSDLLYQMVYTAKDGHDKIVRVELSAVSFQQKSDKNQPATGQCSTGSQHIVLLSLAER